MSLFYYFKKGESRTGKNSKEFSMQMGTLEKKKAHLMNWSKFACLRRKDAWAIRIFLSFEQSSPQQVMLEVCVRKGVFLEADYYTEI